MLDQLNNDLKRLLKLTSEIATINQMLVYHMEWAFRLKYCLFKRRTKIFI